MQNFEQDHYLREAGKNYTLFEPLNRINYERIAKEKVKKMGRVHGEFKQQFIAK